MCGGRLWHVLAWCGMAWRRGAWRGVVGHHTCHTMKARLKVENMERAVRYFLAKSSAGFQSSRRACQGGEGEGVRGEGHQGAGGRQGAREGGVERGVVLVFGEGVHGGAG